MAETLYLIDAYAQIFRAYYAIRGGMHSPVTSEPTHAVFGFTGMLLKLLELRPDYVAVAVDAPGKTFRDEMYSEYKATRDAAPDDLHSQIPRVFELVERFGIPLVSCPGLEADDVIASITQQVLDDPACSGINVRIISKDKDLEQLLCERVALFDIHTDTLIDVAALKELKGIAPEQVVDVLTLTGDTVDNVPGVDGIGLKTAALLVQQFGSLDGVLANLDQIKGKRRENLEKAQAHLPLSRTLVTLKRDAALDFSLDAARARPPDPERLLPLFQQLGFNRFQVDLRRLAGSGAHQSNGQLSLEDHASANGQAPPDAVVPLSDEGVYTSAASPDELDELCRVLREQPLVSLQVATLGGGRDAEVCGLAFAWKEGAGVYVRIPGDDGTDPLAVLRAVLEDEQIPKCGHNIKLSTRHLLRSGIRLRGVRCDPMLAAMLAEPGLPAHKLDHLALSLLSYRIADGAADTEAGVETALRSAAQAADVALRLARHFAARLDQMGMVDLLAEVEAPLSAVVAEMELNGILCDPEELRVQGELLAARAAELRREIHALAGCEFHVDSPKQLGDVLFDRLGLKAGKKNKTGRSTDIEVLEKLAAEEDSSDPRTSIPRLVIEYRHLQKLISTYMGNLRESVSPATGRIHTTFHQMYTATGRIASHGPNLQTIPVRTEVGRQIRKAFVAPPGHLLLCADYSQIELRILAHLSEDPALLEAFAQDLDIHTAVAAQVFGTPPGEVTREQRGYAKTINFGIIYGITPFGLSQRIRGLDVPAATRLIADYKARFPGIDRFLQQCIQHALEHGYVTTLMGRRRAIPEITSSNRNTRNLGERLAINSVVQGSGADLIKRAMVNVQRRIDRDGLPLKLLLQIHDELVFETPAGAAPEHARIVCEEMERAMTLRIPLRAEAGIGADWMSAK